MFVRREGPVLRLDPDEKRGYLVNRRTLVRMAGGSVYAIPAITVSMRLGEQGASARGDDLISAPVNQTIEPKDDKPKCVVGDGFDVVDSDGDGVETVTVDGSGSVDPDGQIEQFTWTLKGVQVADTAVASVDLPIGTHRLVLTITDKSGNTDSAKLRIRVKRGPEQTDEPTAVAEVPQPPYDVRIKQDKADLVIKWREQERTPNTIRIYRVVDDLKITEIDEREWELLKELSDEKREYTDLTYVPGTPYLTALRSYDGSIESEWSNVVAFTPVEYNEESEEEEREDPVAPTEEPPPPPTDVPVEVPTETPVPTEPPPPPTEEPPVQSEESEPDTEVETTDA